MVAFMKTERALDGVFGPDPVHLPAHVPSGPALLAIALSEEARGIRGLDILRRSVDRAPPVRP